MTRFFSGSGARYSGYAIGRFNFCTHISLSAIEMHQFERPVHFVWHEQTEMDSLQSGICLSLLREAILSAKTVELFAL